MTERPLTTRQLAERWQCSDRHLRDLIDAGKLPAFRVGRMYRVPAWAVREAEECRSSQDSSDIADDGQRRGRKVVEPSGGRSAPVIVPLPSRS
ncbi:MAG: helix-turn-helix domain-containing protein [Gammaproteobacteria bacterium]